MKTTLFKALTLCAAIAGLTACETISLDGVDTRQINDALASEPRQARRSADASVTETEQTEINERPGAPGGASASADPARELALSGSRAGAAFENAPIPEFINAVFAETLGLTITIDEEVTNRREMITLRTPETLPARELFNVAAAALDSYGVTTAVIGERTVRFLPEQQLSQIEPAFVRGRSTPETPQDLRPVMHYYPTRALSAGDLAQLTSGLLPERLRMSASPADSALLLFGSPDDVSSAVRTLSRLDQPRFAGRTSLSIDPAFLGADALAGALQETLSAEGYEVALGADDGAPVLIMPLPAANLVYVFASSDEALSHARRLARELDTPGRAGPTRRAFVYYARNTSADTLSDIASAVVERTGMDGAAGPQPAIRPGEQQSGGGQRGGEGGEGGAGAARGQRIVVDSGRNAIVFVGTANEYATLLPVLQELDRSPGEVLIEASIVEVTLNANEDLGVDFLTDFGLGEFGAEVSTRGGVGVGSSGLLFRLFDESGDVRGVLNAFSRDERVSILSNPRLLARSGLEASIEVGTEVPVLQQQATDDSIGNGGILSSISYRRTGVILTVTPVVRSGERIDIALTQEVSEAQSNNTSDISSPLILNRAISTSLSLRDGQTVLLGGLISQNLSESTTGVPGLRNVPGLGHLFRSQSVGRSKTELLVFLTPYLIDTAERSDAVTELFQEQTETWPDVAGRLSWW